jgi:hypothetical protein
LANEKDRHGDSIFTTIYIWKPGFKWIFQLQVAGETEVKGQVKLMLKDIGGHRVIATRSLVSTQKVTLSLFSTRSTR